MPSTTTRLFRERVARVVVGEAAIIVPATLKVGTGRYSNLTGVVAPLPTDTDLETPVLGGIPVSLERQGHAVIVRGTVAGGAVPYQITEAGIFAADATALVLDSFLPTQLQQGQSFDLEYTLYPEVDQS